MTAAGDDRSNHQGKRDVLGFYEDLSAILDAQEQHSVRLDELANAQARHTATLAGLAGVQTQQTVTLAELADVQAQHAAALAEHGMKLDRIIELLERG
jgi:hypothetical protein